MAYTPTAANAFKGPAGLGQSQSGDWVGQDCQSAVGKLAETIKKISDKKIKKSRKEGSKAKKDFENKKSGGMWDQLTAGPLAELKAKYAEIEGQASDVQNGNYGMLGEVGRVLDLGQTYAGATMSIVSDVVSDVVDDYAFVSELTDAVGLGPMVPSGQASSCNQMLLAGTVGAAFRMAGRTVGNAVQAVYGAQATIGLALDAVPELYAGIMSMPAGVLSVLLTNKATILSRLRSQIEDVVEIVVDMDDDDYPDDVFAFIQQALGELSKADDDLGVVEQTLEGGGKFQEVNWDRAHDIIEETGEALWKHAGYDLSFAFSKILKLLGFMTSLQTMTKILADRQASFAKLAGTIGKFKAEFESNADFKNVAAPFVQQIRCKLQTIIVEMEKSIEKKTVLAMYIKQKRWGKELEILAILMNTFKKMIKFSTPQSINLNAAADHLSDEVGNWQNNFSQTESYKTLNTLIGSFVKEMKRKMVTNVDPAVLQGIAQAIYTEIDVLNASDSELEGLLNGFNSTIASAGLSAVQAVTGLMDLMEEAGLDNMISALAQGDWENVFSWDALKSNAEAVAKKAVGDLLQCCKDNAGDGDTTRRLVRINRVLAASQKAKLVYERYTKGYASRHVSATVKEIIPALQQMKSDVQKVSTSKCVNKGETGQVGEALGLLRLTLG